MKDIGGIYPIEQRVLSSSGKTNLPFFTEPNIRYFSLCREALLTIARSLHKEHGKVLLPAYTCQTVIEPFVELGWECSFFGISEKLRIDGESLKEQYDRIRPDVIVVHPYYGMDLTEGEIKILRDIKDGNCVFVEDMTQCLFSSLRDDVFDYYVGSMRKWFPIPDGAFAFSLKKKLEMSGDLPQNEQFVNSMLDAMYLRGIYYKSGDVAVKEISRGIDKSAGRCVAQGISAHAISDYSQAALTGIDLSEVQNRRRINYELLWEEFTCAGVKKVCQSLEEVTSAPLYFPVLVEDRLGLMQKLIEQRIYAPVLWPVKTEEVLINEAVAKIYNHILAIPCDQRYCEEDMGRIIGAVLS